jgi:hypothetical protein
MPVMERESLLVLADLNYIEALREQTRACGGAIVEEDGLVLMAGSDPHPILNAAVRTDPELEAADFLELAAEFYDAHGHGYTVVVRASTDDRDVAQGATEMGLVSLLSPPEMIVEHRLPDAPAPEGAELRRVVDGDGLRDFSVVAQDAWGTYGIPQGVTAQIFDTDRMLAPHIAAVVAYVDDEPASGALTILSHGIAGIYWVSTAQSARGGGLAEACTRLVTNVSFDLGARAVSLQASPMGEPIYRRMGYEQIGQYQLLAKLPADLG